MSHACGIGCGLHGEAKEVHAMSNANVNICTTRNSLGQCQGHVVGSTKPHCKYGHPLSDWMDNPCPMCDANVEPLPPTRTNSVWEYGEDGPYSKREIELLRLYDEAASDKAQTRLIRKTVATIDALTARLAAREDAAEAANEVVRLLGENHDAEVAALESERDRLRAALAERDLGPCKQCKFEIHDPIHWNEHWTWRHYFIKQPDAANASAGGEGIGT
jgi:hypothetical protein